MPPNPPTGPPSKEALRLALQLERQGKSLEAQALRAVNAQYQGVNIRHLAALVGLATDFPAPPERVTHLDALMGAFREAAQPLAQPPSALGELLRQAVQVGIHTSASMVGVKVTRPSAQAEYTQHATQRLSLYWNKEQTRLAGEVSSVLLEGLQRGQSAAQLVARLCERLDVSRSRSRLIAANETDNALSTAMQETQIGAGVTHYIWHSSQSKHPRNEHHRRHGQVFAWNKPPMGGHPGQAVMCRCVAVPVQPEGKQIFGATIAEENMTQHFERTREGLQYKKLSSVLPRKDEAYVLRGINTAGLLEYLKVSPLESLEFLSIPDSGRYFWPTKRLQVKNDRAAESFGEVFIPGQAWSISSVGKNSLSAMRRSLAHELGHHILWMEAETFHNWAQRAYIQSEGRRITQYADTSWSEYFCETFAAYAFHRAALRQHDPIGYAMMERVKEVLDAKVKQRNRD